MTKILIKNIIQELKDLPDDFKTEYSETLNKIKFLLDNLIQSINNSHTLSKSISTSTSTIFKIPSPKISIDEQLNDLKDEMLSTISKNRSSLKNRSIKMK